MRKLLTLSALIVIIDQVAKLYVKGFNIFGIAHTGMEPYQQKNLIGDLVRLTYVENPGMAFGLNFDLPVVLSVFSIAASIFLVYLLRRTERQGMTGLRVALAMILGGAVGNLIDRVFYGVFYGYAPLFHGKVVDFVDINIPDINIFGFHLERFYVFNIADAAVTVGVILLLIFYPSKRDATREVPAEETQVTTEEKPVEGSIDHPTLPPSEPREVPRTGFQM